MYRPTRIVSWNCKRATRTSPVWDYLRELAPDVAVLQEVISIPSTLEQEFVVQYKLAMGKTGRPQRFGSALLVRGAIIAELSLQTPYGWANRELASFAGNLLAYAIRLEPDLHLNVVGVYNPAWPLDRVRLADSDLTGVKLTLNRDVWLGDLLWSALQLRGLEPHERWVVAGDFNLSESFDWPGRPRRNKEYLDRMETLGLVDCLRTMQGGLTPTFRNPAGGAMLHQIDHLFATPALVSRLVSCETGDPQQVFGPPLSDHLPIIADFTLTG